jgi:hypothetical protein
VQQESVLIRPNPGEFGQNPAMEFGRYQIPFFAVGNFFMQAKPRKIFSKKIIFSEK